MGTEAARVTARKLNTLDVWALAVGIVICGQFFGWNLGLAGNGPVAMLLASLFVCLLFAALLLALSELAVAMPYADGPLEYGRRAWGPGVGFVMGWSLLLAGQFGAGATAIAAGQYVAFLVNPAAPSPWVALAAALATVVLFFFVQAWGVKEQAWVLLAMLAAALAALLIFWGIAADAFSWAGAWPAENPLGPKGWLGVVDAAPYALWWLIIIEGAALSAEECRNPGRSIPRGLLAAIAAVAVMVVLTLTLGCGAMPWERFSGQDDHYPLGKVAQHALGVQDHWLLRAFGLLALFGLVASYHGLLYLVSRQALALGWAGYLPPALGRLHATRHTPVLALLASSLVTAGFVGASTLLPVADVAILLACLASLVWYILAMFCLLRLRAREPGLLLGYRAPFGALLPWVVIVLALLTLGAFARVNVAVLPVGAALYAAGMGYYWLAGRHRVRALARRETAPAEGGQP